MSLLRWLALLVAAILGRTACGGTGGSQQPSSNDPVVADVPIETAREDDPLCLQPIPAEKVAELQSYTDQQPDATGPIPYTDSVCVRDAATGIATYYSEEDNFAQYWLYAMLL